MIAASEPLAPEPPFRVADRALVDLDDVVHVLTCGSVDDGKSTLVGRLLWDATALHDDQRARLLQDAGPDGSPDFSRLLDGLMAEQEQGITIDVAWRYADAAGRRIVFIDAPGHEQYTRNMASGASHADVAVMLVDARSGLKRQTRRHAAILGLVGVRRVVLAVNKMDLIDYSESEFRRIEQAFAALAGRFSFEDAVAVPISAKHGDNVAGRSLAMQWHDGPTILDLLATPAVKSDGKDGLFRFPTQSVIRGVDGFRGLAGTVAAGRVAVGDRVEAGGRHARVRRIATMDGDLASAEAGDAVAIELDADLDISRGAMLAAADAAAPLARRLTARLVWLADTRLAPDQRLLLRTQTDLVPVVGFAVSARLDLESLAEAPTSEIGLNEIAEAAIELARPTALDRFDRIAATGRFVLVDALNGDTVAGGVVLAAGDREGGRAGGFELTDAMLLAGVCAGLRPEDPAFAERAAAAEELLRAAGVNVARALR